MAYRPIQINPLDLQPSTAIGVAIPFDNQSAFTSVYTTANQLKYNIINYLLTDKRERLFNAGFGAGLRSELFEQMVGTDLEATELRIKTDIENYFPRVALSEIKLIPTYDENYLTLRIRYSILNTNTNDEITLNFNNGI